MDDKKEARRSLAAGRATHLERYTGMIPHEDFERGCKALATMFAAFMALAFAWEVMGL